MEHVAPVFLLSLSHKTGGGLCQRLPVLFAAGRVLRNGYLNALTACAVCFLKCMEFAGVRLPECRPKLCPKF